MATAIATPTITINNVTVQIVPNTFVYDEGLGEQTVRTQSAGGGSVQVVFSDNAEMKYSTFKFSVYPTPENISELRALKVAGNANAVSATDNNTGFTKHFLEAALTSKYDVPLGTDTVIETEWKSAQVIGE